MIDKQVSPSGSNIKKLPRTTAYLTFIAVATPLPLYAQEGLESLKTGIIETIVYSVIGIIMAVIGFKVVDWLTPGNLAEDVAHKENRALAILAGSMILGVCLIIAATLLD